jgi:hypothetical protein
VAKHASGAGTGDASCVAIGMARPTAELASAFAAYKPSARRRLPHETSSPLGAIRAHCRHWLAPESAMSLGGWEWPLCAALEQAATSRWIPGWVLEGEQWAVV